MGERMSVAFNASLLKFENHSTNKIIALYPSTFSTIGSNHIRKKNNFDAISMYYYTDGIIGIFQIPNIYN
jgi:hypothetical protein